MASGELAKVDDADARAKRSAMTETLLANSHKSLQEVSDLTGIPVAELGPKYTELFENRGWLSERQEERKLLIDLGDLLARSKDRLNRANDEDYAAIAKTLIQGYDLMARRFDNRKKLVDEDINKLTSANARIMGEAVGEALKYLAEKLEAEYSVPQDMVEAFMTIGLKRAADKLEDYVA